MLLTNYILCITIYIKEVHYIVKLEDWKSQIKKGTLEFRILLMIDEKPCYGYELMAKLDKWEILKTKESTIYPLLRRLLKEEFLTSSWQETSEGLPPRKYYSITQKGKDYLHMMLIEWDNLLSAISEIKGES